MQAAKIRMNLKAKAGLHGNTVAELDEYYMEKALSLARKAYQLGEIPIGALIVSPEGQVLGSGYNMTESRHAQSEHAEIRAIEQAGKKALDWRLDECTIYVTLQPCLMCMSLICLSRIARLVYGATSPLFGYDLGKEGMPQVYQKHLKGVTSGVLADESKKLLEQFFKQKRNKSEQF